MGLDEGRIRRGVYESFAPVSSAATAAFVFRDESDLLTLCHYVTWKLA